MLIGRFRGNFVVGEANFAENDAPFEEEEWKDLNIGDLSFKVKLLLLSVLKEFHVHMT